MTATQKKQLVKFHKQIKEMYPKIAEWAVTGDMMTDREYQTMMLIWNHVYDLTHKMEETI